MKNLIFWLVFCFLGIAIPLLCLEVGGRLYIAAKYGVEGKSYGLWRYDAKLGAIHRENGYNSNATTNDYGFRNIEPVFEPKPANSTRVITYGGSTTFCYNLSNTQTWPAQLEGLMRSHAGTTDTGFSREDQVLNGGAILWSIGHAFARAQSDLPRLKPDFVVIYSGINEETNASYLNRDNTPLSQFVANKEYGRFATNLDQNRWAKRNLFLVRLVDYIVKPILQPTARADDGIQKDGGVSPQVESDRVVEENYQQTLVAFLRLIKENDAQAIFVAQAHSAETPKNRQYTGYSQRAMGLAEAHGAIVLNAQEMVDTSDIPSNELFSSSGVHYSELGALKLAEFIFARGLNGATNPMAL